MSAVPCADNGAWWLYDEGDWQPRVRPVFCTYEYANGYLCEEYDDLKLMLDGSFRCSFHARTPSEPEDVT